MRLLDEIKSLLLKYNIHPQRNIGQNFCVDDKLLEKLISYSNLSKDDTVLEIGVGFGFLTSLLSKVAKRVIAVELDSKLLRAARSRLRNDNITIIFGDILKVELPNFNKVVANPPYSISYPLMMRLFSRSLDCAVLTLQEEFAYKIIAKEGARNYGPLAVIKGYKACVDILEKLSRDSFYPQPKVTSVVVSIKFHEPRFHVIDEEFFFRFVKYLFTQRNRKAKKPLESFLKKMLVDKNETRMVIESLPFVETRVYNIKPKEFGAISNKVYSFLHSKKIFFKDYKFYVFPKVYEPSDDTFLIAEHLDVGKNENVLDMGTGCGILGVLAAEKAGNVVAVDINPEAVECAKFNAKLNYVSDKVETLCSNLFNKFEYDIVFDLIIFNPPYLPVDFNIHLGKIKEQAWYGGVDGRKIIDKFLNSVDQYILKNGRILMIQSSLSNPEKSLRRFRKMGFETDIIAEKQLFFEKLFIIRAKRNS